MPKIKNAISECKKCKTELNDDAIYCDRCLEIIDKKKFIIKNKIKV